MQKKFFINNRQRFTAALQGGVAILSGYTQMQRRNDMAFKFEQESNFWWLTGVEAPDWWLIVDGTRGKSWLVAPVLSEARQLFDGGLSPDDAQTISGVDAVISDDAAQLLLRDLAKKHSTVCILDEQQYAGSFDFTLNPALKSIRDVARRHFNATQDCRKELALLRAIKQPEEIVAMKRAIHVTNEAFQVVRQRMNTYAYEYEIEADFTHYFRRSGSEGHAYDPIVASGQHACTLHYVANNEKLKKRQLVLIDIGAKVDGYAADITRTYALGEPTKRQVQVHLAVQLAQQRIIKLIQPDLSIEQYQRDVDLIMSEALMSLDLMSSVEDTDKYRMYFPHAISHGLGVDVHDSLGGPKYLESGMVLTVEPGIYIPEESIGVRIEDDILVNDTGHVNLSAKLSTDL